MWIIDVVKNAVRRVLRRKAEEVVEHETEKAINKELNKAVNSTDSADTTKNATTQELKEENERLAQELALKQAKAAVNSEYYKQRNEVLQYLIFDDEMNVIGLKDDAPDYIKTAYKEGKFNE